MKYCENCGNQLQDDAQFCHNCGQPVNLQLNSEEQPKSFLEAFKEGWQEGKSDTENQNNNQLSNNDELGIGKKIGLWWGVFVAGLGLAIGIDEGNFFAIIISACALGVFGGLYKGGISTKYTWASVIILPLMVFYTLGSDSKDNEHNPQSSVVEQKQEDSKPSSDEKKKEEKKNHVEERSPKEKEVANAAYNWGYAAGLSDNSNLADMVDMADRVDGMKETVNKTLEDMAGSEYNREYGKPANAAEEKLKKIYIEEFIKGMKKGWNDR